MTKEYNTTDLRPDKTFEKHVFHRDQFAHYFRWCHALKRIKPNKKIKLLDFGCGCGNMAEVIYRNRGNSACELYIGLDIRKQTIDKANEKWKNVPWATFEVADLVVSDLSFYSANDFDMITCFEVAEHVQKKNIHAFLKNLHSIMTEKTELLLSTPIYDPSVGAAKNHIIDGEVCEFDHDELRDILCKYFNITEQYATFASIKDYKSYLELDPTLKVIYQQLHNYYDSDLLSNIMAPLIPPELGRNCLWVLKKR